VQLTSLTAQLRHRGVDTAVELRRGGRTCTRHEVGVCWEVVHVQCDPCHRHARHEGAAQAVITRWWIPDDVQIKTLFGKSTPKSAHDYDPPPASP
jgi:hypothetical protein